MDFLSFIIPAFNEEDTIAEVIDTIVHQNIISKSQYEIIVVDNGSTDSTSLLAARSGAVVLKTEKSTVANARNEGVGIAKGNIYSFIDADVILTKRWFVSMHKLMNDSSKPSKFLTGAHVVIPEEPSWIEKYWFSGKKSNNYIGSANIICSSLAFDSVGGFDVNKKTGEDYDFCMRIKGSGATFNVDPGFEAIHLGYPKNIAAFFKREIWHGLGDVQSLPSFLKSKVSIVGLLYLFLILTFVFLCLASLFNYASMIFLFFFAINSFLTLKLRTINSLTSFFANSLLNSIYFLGRSFSVLFQLKSHFFK